MNLHFLHVRKTNDEGTLQSKGGTTFAFEVVPITSPQGEQQCMVRYSAARCHSEKQTFSRKLGRAVSEGRYNKGQVEACFIAFPQDGKTFDAARALLAGLV